jgi:hypothetical protein
LDSRRITFCEVARRRWANSWLVLRFVVRWVDMLHWGKGCKPFCWNAHDIEIRGLPTKEVSQEEFAQSSFLAIFL